MTTFGERLRRERKARGVSLGEVAESTKIGARFLEAIESDEFDRLPGGVFDRGFVRAYAEAVGLDPEATVEAYLEQRRARTIEAPDRTLEALRHAAETRSGATPPRRIAPRPLVFAAGFVVALAGVAGVWIWIRHASGDEVRATAPVAAPTTEASYVPGEGPGDSVGIPVRTADSAAATADSTGATADPPAAGSGARPSAATTAASDAATDTVPIPVPVVPTPRPEPVPTREPVERRAVETSPTPPASRLEARIVIDRPVSGSLNCDNRRVEVLDGLRAGTELELVCGKFLIVQIDDGGALRLGLGDAAPRPLGPSGEPVQRQLVP